MSLFSKLKNGLTRTRRSLLGKLEELVTGTKKIDEDFYDELEELLIQADIGVNMAMDMTERLRRVVKEKKIEDPNQVIIELKQFLTEIFAEDQDAELDLNGQPAVIMMVGVNGVGKTTSIAKIAYSLKNQGLKVILAAADTFRAAAIDQLEIWGGRIGADVIKHQEGADPGAVVFDAIQAAKARHADVLIIDTAGRLHTKNNLMAELKKIKRIIERELPDAPVETLLVLDATTGQNAVSQAKTFGEATDVTGIVLTKLDGTAKGGIIIAIRNDLQIPVKFVGVGEKMDDLQPFIAGDFVEALFQRPAAEDEEPYNQAENADED